MARVIREPPIEFARFAHVMEHQHAAAHGSGAVANRRGGALDIELVAVAPDEQHRPHGLDRARAADRNGQRILERLAGFLVEGAEDLVDRPSLRVFQPPAGQLLGDRIDVFDAGARVGRDDAVADRLQRDLRAFLLAKQRLLVELALRDVELDADDAAQPPARLDPRFRAAHHPAPFAVAMLQAMHAFKERRLADHVIAHGRLHACEIVRMHELAPVGRVVQLVLGVAEHGLPARREIDRIEVGVEIPQAVVRAREREVVTFLHVLEVLAHANALEAGRKARADELEQQVLVDIPALARAGRCQAHESGDAAPHRKADQQQRADLQLREAQGFAALFGFRIAGIAIFQDADMAEARPEPGHRFERLGLEDLRRTLGEHALRNRDARDTGAVLGEAREENSVGGGGGAQIVEILRDAGGHVLARHALELDRDLGAGDVESKRGAVGRGGPDLGRKDVGGGEIDVRFVDHGVSGFCGHCEWRP